MPGLLPRCQVTTYSTCEIWAIANCTCWKCCPPFAWGPNTTTVWLASQCAPMAKADPSNSSQHVVQRKSGHLPRVESCARRLQGPIWGTDHVPGPAVHWKQVTTCTISDETWVWKTDKLLGTRNAFHLLWASSFMQLEHLWRWFEGGLKIVLQNLRCEYTYTLYIRIYIYIIYIYTYARNVGISRYHVLSLSLARWWGSLYRPWDLSPC